MTRKLWLCRSCLEEDLFLFKKQGDDNSELLWVPETWTREKAWTEANKQDSARGVVIKNSSPLRLAIRLRHERGSC